MAGRYQKRFEFEVLTPEGQACFTEAVSVVFPASDGMVGVLGRRGPMVALMGAGPLTVKQADGDDLEFYVAGGFAHSRSGLLTLTAEECIPIAELSRDEAWREIERARALPTRTTEELDRRQMRLDIARAKFNLAQRYYRQAHGSVISVDEEDDLD